MLGAQKHFLLRLPSHFFLETPGFFDHSPGAAVMVQSPELMNKGRNIALAALFIQATGFVGSIIVIVVFHYRKNPTFASSPGLNMDLWCLEMGLVRRKCYDHDTFGSSESSS
ncbi:hypothetical protein L218DRAFT_1067738 [Marasmius fiardii PR-910]|nr:hypothetical protein L218DRAFT_1067738 [Marasmius fiardii PR-910]